LALGENRGALLIVKTYLKGKTFKTYLENIGSYELGTHERTFYLQEFTEGCYQAGKAIDELNSKGIKREYLKHGEGIGSLEWAFRAVEDTIKALNLPRLKTDMSYLHSLAQNLEKSHCETHSYLLADVHSDQFTWIPGELIGLVDAEGITAHLDLLKKPTALAAENFYNFFKLIDQGLCQGLTVNETHILKEAFKRGYASEFKGQLSEASERFFEFNSKIRTLFYLTSSLEKGEMRNKTQVEEFIKQWNRELKSNQKPVRKRIKDFLKDDAGV
jgi:hypothetical protein